MVALLLLALALAMDAFAAALAQGAAVRPHPSLWTALRVGLAFGVAQALMPLLGWSLGVAFATTIREVDHWIAFILLSLIGGRMVHAGIAAEEDASEPARVYSGWALAGAAIATSIDAAAAGVTIPMLGVPVAVSCAVIGVVAFLLSTSGVLLGHLCGKLLGRRAEVLGGLVLIGIGVSILYEHAVLGAG